MACNMAVNPAKAAPAKQGVKASKYMLTEEQDKIICNYCEDLKKNICTILQDSKKPLHDPNVTL